MTAHADRAHRAPLRELRGVLTRHEERAATVEPYDNEVLALINKALALQEKGGYAEDPNDRQVLLLLKQAQVAQEKDIAEDHLYRNPEADR